MKKKIVKEMLYWGAMGLFTVFGIRILRYGFNSNVIKGDFLSELILGVGIFILFTLYKEINKYKKNKSQNN